MKLLVALLAGVALASPAELGNTLEKRAKCALNDYFNLYVDNAASASAFCSGFYVAMTSAKTTVTTTSVATSTVKTVTVKNTTPTITSTTTLVIWTGTVTTTVSPVAKRDQDLATRYDVAQELPPQNNGNDLLPRDNGQNLFPRNNGQNLSPRANGLPGFVEAYESAQATSACSCLLPAFTSTYTSTKTINSVLRTTATQFGTTTVTSVLTIPTASVVKTLTVTSSSASCPTNAISNGDFEGTSESGSAQGWTWYSGWGGVTFGLANYVSYPCIGEWCGVFRAPPNYAIAAYTPFNACPGATYTLSATFQLLDFEGTKGVAYCNPGFVVFDASGNNPQYIGQGHFLDDNQHHIYQTTYTAPSEPVNIGVTVACNGFSASTIYYVTFDSVTAIRQ